MIDRKGITRIVFILALMGLVFHCDKNPVGPDPASFPLAIYMLDDPPFDREKFLDEDYSDFKLKGEPWLTDEDIEFYDWASHCIYLKISKEDLFPQYGDAIYIIENFRNKMFIVAVDGEICYPAFFNYGGYFRIPELDLDAVLMYPDDVLRIKWTGALDIDRRNNEKVKAILIQEGLFHAGLEVRLDSVTIMENADTSTVEYTFTLTNNDEDNLYIFDPELTSSFHYFMNGPVYRTVEEGNLGLSKYRTIVHWDSWDPAWYSMLESGKSLTRTVLLRAYPYFLPGMYQFHFFYSGPMAISREDRYTTDGRYWLGRIESNYFTISIEE